MENYKIQVNNESESKEAQELFFELGYIVVNHVDNEKGFIVVSKEADSPFNFDYWCSVDKELTLPQLRDLVVLKRGDGITDSTAAIQNAINPSINKPKETALISGAEALRALADGVKPEEIEGKFFTGLAVQFLSMNGKVDVFLKYLNEKLFRLKPQTIKLELELPKPFEPEEDCHVYILDDGKTDGYRCYSYEVHGDKGNTFIGIWRTEEEIKQVVEQLRKIKGAV